MVISDVSGTGVTEKFGIDAPSRRVVTIPSNAEYFGTAPPLHNPLDSAT